MVNWDRVQELRSKGWDWADIAKDPKVDFHPDATAGAPGRALRALWHRSGRRAQAAIAPAEVSKRPRKEEAERKWTLARLGYLLVPVLAVWFALAYAAPSPVGLVLPAIPYLALGLAVMAFVLIYALWRRTGGPRWSKAYAKTVASGVVLGLVVAGSIGLAGTLIFGCPYLPPASSLSSGGGPGWEGGPLPAWQSGGKPVVFFYGATWCPFCSASSWAIYKALTEFATVSGTALDHSSLVDSYPGTPEMVLAGLSLSSKGGFGPAVDFQPVEDTSGVKDTLPGTSSCYQQAYFTSYGGGIPFVVVNGQNVHPGSFVNDPGVLAPWNWVNSGNSLSGASTVLTSVNGESGQPWTLVQDGAWWIMAYIAKDLGYSTATLSTLQSDFGWSTSTYQNVSTDLGNIS